MVLKGNILFMENLNNLCSIENGYLVIDNGIIEKAYTEKEFKIKYHNAYKDINSLDIIDYGDKLIIPGMVDLHLHAAQYAFCGLGMDMELMEWLEHYAFPEEIKYSDVDYAKMAYGNFVDALVKSPTTRACVFATIHKDSTLKLVKLLNDAGFVAYVGKVNMDRNVSGELLEDTDKSIEDTVEFIEDDIFKHSNIKPIITPRFVPACSDNLMKRLSELRKKYNLPVQSHLSENLSEIETVKKLNKKAKFYGDAYNMFELFGGEFPTIMAHCVYSEDAEIKLIKENGVYVAHCANSNYSLASGIAPIRKYIDYGLNIGLGTDIAGGFSISMFRAIQDTVAVSKLNWRLKDNYAAPLSFKEAFYLATMGGGSFFGKAGSFLPGYEADILILDDCYKQCPLKLNIAERLERICYLAGENTVYAKYIKGSLVFKREEKQRVQFL